jgi:hypothetical protein
MKNKSAIQSLIDDAASFAIDSSTATQAQAELNALLAIVEAAKHRIDKPTSNASHNALVESIHTLQSITKG